MKNNKLANTLARKIGIGILSNTPMFFVYFIIGLAVIVPITFIILFIGGFMAIFNSGSTETSLSYYESDSFYGMPYNKAFKGKDDYKSIFTLNPSLTGKVDKDLNKINLLIEDKANNTLISTIPGLDKKKCGDYCDNKIGEVFDIKLVISDKYKYKDLLIDNIINSDIGKENIHYFSINIKNKIKKKDYNIYFYENANGEDVEDSLYRYKDSIGKIHNSLFVKQRQNLTLNEYYKGGLSIHPNLPKTSKYNNINSYINEYFFDKKNFIGRIKDNNGGLWEKTDNLVFVNSMSYLFSGDVGDKSKGILTKTINKDYLTLYDSNIIDMLNFSGIKSSNNRNSSLSNQFLLSQENINLAFFQRKNFGKNYKELIFYPEQLQQIEYEDVAKILNYKKERKTDLESNKFGYIIGKDIGYHNIGDKTQKKVEALNDKEILTDGSKFYSKDYKYPELSGWSCSPLYPSRGTYDDLVSYTKEALYTGQSGKMDCSKSKKGKDGKSKRIHRYIEFEVPALIQKASITYYKKFIFSDENKKSYRNKKDYNFNYFYDKSYIQEGSTLYGALNLVNNIYLDRKSVLFKGVYMKISGFGIEIKDKGRLITAKKEANSYKPLLPDSPIKIEIGVLTDLDTTNLAVSEFDLNNNPTKGFLGKDKQLYDIGGSDKEISIYNYEKVYNLDKENSLLKKVIKSANKYNTKIEDIKNIENLYTFSYGKIIGDDYNILGNFFLGSESYDKVYLGVDKKEVINKTFNLKINELFTKYKNNYFYDSAQKEKLVSILDDVYNINNKENNLENIFKKHIILFSDMTECNNGENCEIKEINKNNNKNIFNKNILDNTENIKLKTFDKCSLYKNIGGVYNKVLNNIEDDYIVRQSYSLLEKSLIEPCYNSYYPYIEIEIKGKNKEIEKNIVNTLGGNKDKRFLSDFTLYRYKNNNNYNVKLSPYNSQIYDMFDNNKDKKEDNEILGVDLKEIITPINDFFTFNDTEIESSNLYDLEDNTVEKKVYNMFSEVNIDPLDIIWKDYTEIENYKLNCDEDENHKKNSDLNFLCSKDEIYSEFIQKIKNTPNYYYFLKEEYLKEKIQDEEFKSFYNDSLLGECDSQNFCEDYKKGRRNSISSNKIVPLNYSKYKYRSPLYQKKYKNDIINTNYDNNIRNNNINGDNEYINDFSYTLDIGKSFSYKSEDFNQELNLHTISINPNIYLHSFITDLDKNNDKYVLNFFGKGLSGVLNDRNKKNFEKSYINKLNYFITEKINGMRLLIDSYSILSKKDKSDYTEWNEDYNIFFGNYDLANYISGTTISNNLENYIDNVGLFKLLGNNYKGINNQNISMYDIKIPYGIIDIYYKTDKKKSIFNKYLYNIYLNNVIKEKKEEEFSKITNSIVNNSSFDKDNLEYNYNNDEINLIKDTLLYNMGYLDLESKTLLSWSFGSFISFGSKWVQVHNTQDLIDEPYKELYKQSNISGKKSLKSIEYIISKEDIYKTSYLNNIGKYIYDDKGKRIYLNSLDYKKEKVLNLELYYGDLLEITKKYDSTLEPGTLKRIINRQQDAIKYLKEYSYSNYYKYYLNPIISGKILEKITQENFKKEIDKLYLDASNKELFITEYSDYLTYMNIIKIGLPNEDIIESNIILPFKTLKGGKEYSFTNSEYTNTEEVRNAFLKRGDSSYLPTYRTINDLFFNKSLSDSSEIVKVNAIEETTKNIKRSKEKIEKLKEKRKLVKTKYKKNIDKEIINTENAINNYTKYLENYTENDFFEYRVGLDEITGDISIKKLGLSNNTEEKEIKEDINQKIMFFTGPFDSYSNDGFVTVGEEDLFLEYYANSQLNLSFNLNNLRSVEMGLKNMINELVIYSNDFNNEKVESLNNFEAIGNLYYLYANNGYTNARKQDETLKFEIKLKDGREIDDLSGSSSIGSLNIYSMRNDSTKNILNQRFEDLKTTYCKNFENSKKQTCVDYMSYLQSMTLSEINAEMEYLTAYLMLKDNKINPTYELRKYDYLAKKFKKGDLNRDILFDYFKNNDGNIGQCTWYAKLLKGKGLEKRGNGRDFYPDNKRKGFPTDSIDPRIETEEAIIKKIQIGDVISFNGRNGKAGTNAKCDYYGEDGAAAYGHVAIVKDVNKEQKTVTLAEANVVGAIIIDTREYKVSNLCAGGVVHGVDWKY